MYTPSGWSSVIARLPRVAAAIAGLATMAATLAPTAADGITSSSTVQAPRVAAQPVRPVKATGPSAADPVLGIPKPCKPQHAWPAGARPAEVKRQLAANTGIQLVGAGWDDPKNAPMVKIIWETLEALDCTSYLDVVKKSNPGFAINAAHISGWAFGDWGLTRPNAVTLDVYKWHEPYKAGDRGRLVRLVVHEIGHAWSQTPQAKRAYDRFGQLYARTGNFSDYGRGSVNENFSEVVGYYVARCAAGNPYARAVRNKGQFDAYYRLVRDEVFAGREFGPAVGQTPNCSLAPTRPRQLAQSVGARRVLKEKLDH